MRPISTGSNALDDILGGGVKLGMLTNIFGASGSGKSQLCFQLCVNCTKHKNKKGLDSDVFFIDTNNTFRPERISQIAKHDDLDEQILDRIYVSKVYSAAEQITAIKRVPTMPKLGLVVIDAIGDLFAFEYKQSMAAEKHLRFMKMLRELAMYALNCDVAVVIANGIRYTGTEDVQLFDRSISGFVHFKMRLSRDDGGFRAVLLQPCLEPREAAFKVDDGGVSDV